MNWTRRDMLRIAGTSALGDRDACQANSDTSPEGIIIQRIPSSYGDT